jgi:RNA 2',3'-cyclic 3'-phosphodiesterase
MRKKRLFVAIPIPESIKLGLIPLQKTIIFDTLKWVKPDNLHITVFFMGYVAAQYEEAIKDALANLSLSFQSFSLEFEKIVYAPPVRPSMIWAQYHQNEQFHHTVVSVEKSLRKFTEKTRNYQKPIPHVTLARFRKRTDLNAFHLPEVSLESIKVRSLILYESELTNAGSIYHCVQEYPLKNGT